MDKREHDRYLVEFPATFAGDSQGTGIVYNLGAGGCKIVTGQPPDVGAMLAIYLKVPGQAFAITVRMATVRWIMEHESGIEFLGMEELERERLGQFLQGLQSAVA